MQTILGFVAIVCAGAALRALRLVRREDARALNAAIVYVGLPAFVFGAVHGASLTASALSVIALAWTVFAVLFGLALIAARLMRLPGPRAGGFVLASSLGNTGFIGYPMASSLLGGAAVPFAVFYDVFGTVLQLVCVGIPSARRFAGSQRSGMLATLRELAAFPALGAAILALLLRDVAVPVSVSEWLDTVASMVAPLIMLSVGISLRPRAIARYARELGVLCVARLLAGPGLIVLADRVWSLPPAAYDTALLQAGMPTMMLTLAVGERLGLDDDFIASAVFVTTVTSAVTIPLVQAIVG